MTDQDSMVERVARPEYRQTKGPDTGEWLKVDIATGRVVKRRAEMWLAMKFTDAYVGKIMADLNTTRALRVERINAQIAIDAALKS